MKKVFKKNQVIITTLALMIAVAGYLNFAGRQHREASADGEGTAQVQGDALDISEADSEAAVNDQGEGYDILVANEEEGDELLPSQEPQTSETAPPAVASAEDQDQQAQTSDDAGIREGTPGEAVLTASGVVEAARYNREQVRSESRGTLQEMIDNQNLTQEQKQQAVDAMLEMTRNGELEMAAETLLEAKGFTDVMVNITETSVDVVVNEEDLTDAKLAQIEDVVVRKTGADTSQVVITPVHGKEQ